MQLSPVNRTRFEADFNKLDPAIINLVRGSGVWLSAGNFNASGVIFAFNAARTFILTAKHNLLQGKTSAPGKPSTLVDKFTDKATIRYGAVNFTNRAPERAPLDLGPNNGGNAKIFGGADQDDWTYDVMMLQSSDRELLAYARTFAVTKNLEELNAMSLALATPGLALKREKHVYIQAGFGYSADPVSDSDAYVGRFQVRYTQPTARAVADEVYAYDKDEDVDQVYKNVVRMDADDANSTAPGDSGGPLFLLDTTLGKPPQVLLGVTLGANQSLAKKTAVEDRPILTNSSSYLQVFLCQAIPTLTGC